MSRTARATIAALFGYARFGAAFAIGLALVPFTLHHVGATMYGYWLASGELMAYAALTEFGVLVTLPWLIAEADGRGDRDRMRELVTTGGGAALISALVCLLVSIVLWFALPRVLHLPPDLRSAVIGPVLAVALLAAVAHPLRVFSCVLSGLQDVRYTGVVDLLVLLLGPALTVVLLLKGYGLYALAFATAVPQVVAGVSNLLRVGSIAPDLLRGWRRPEWRAIRRLYVEGSGAWMAGWGWRLISASDGLVLAALGRPTAVAALAFTNKLSQALTQMAWVPCDGGLPGLANLAGEQRGIRLKQTIVVMVRVYLALAGAVACVILAVNPAFVRGWVGLNFYAGANANLVIATLVITISFGHAISVVASVLGQRVQIGAATFAAGVIHVALAFAIGMRLGIVGVLIAGVLSHGLVFAALAWRPFARATGMPETALFDEVVRPWLFRMAPLAVLSLVVQKAIGTPPLPVTIALGGVVGLLAVWYMRPLYLSFGPVRTLYDRVFRWLTPGAARGADAA
jgi:O-antigen/teichoic acid export membrane protein